MKEWKIIILALFLFNLSCHNQIDTIRQEIVEGTLEVEIQTDFDEPSDIQEVAEGASEVEIPTNVDNPTASHVLFKTKWELVGIVDTKTNDMKILEPKSWGTYKRYTLDFFKESVFETLSATNTLVGEYTVNAETQSIFLSIKGGTKVGEIGDGKMWSDDILPTVNSFSLNENELRLYYNNQKNYLLLKKNEL